MKLIAKLVKTQNYYEESKFGAPSILDKSPKTYVCGAPYSNHKNNETFLTEYKYVTAMLVL